jgi:hypothetical protein
MSHKRTTAKLFVLGLCGAVAPCMAFAISAPSGPSLEQIDTTLLGVGQGSAPAAEAGWAIQVGAYADRAMADTRLAQIAERAPDEVAHATRLVTSFEWDNGRMLYRARFGGLNYSNAQAVCAILGRRGESCFVVADQLAKPDHEGVTEAAADPAPLLRGSETAEAQTPATVPVADTVAVEPVKVAVNTVRSSLLNSASQVNNDELSDMRGGFFTAAGAHFDFGASVQTMVNGQLALQTNVQWTPAGAVTQQLAGLGASIQSQVAANLANAGIGTAAANVATNATSNALAAAGITPAASTVTPAVVAPAVTAAPNVAAPAAPATVAQATPVTVGGLSGIQIPGATGGSTQVFANVGAGQIQNIILNSASNQTITQNTNVTLTIYNFPAWQQQIVQNALSTQLAHEIMAASGLGGH